MWLRLQMEIVSCLQNKSNTCSTPHSNIIHSSFPFSLSLSHSSSEYKAKHHLKIIIEIFLDNVAMSFHIYTGNYLGLRFKFAQVFINLFVVSCPLSRKLLS
jgi:hypothetical protein